MSEKLKDTELDKIIVEQEALLANISNLEKGGWGAAKGSWASSAVRSLQRNKAGAGAMLMSGSCAIMALVMLSNKKDYQAKAQELREVVQQAEKERDRALIETEAATARLNALREGVLRELRGASWGMSQRLERLVDQSVSFAQRPKDGGSQDRLPPEQAPSQPKVMPKMI
mmetsp:Transcript_35889/g.101630  ORF Transcript_35889/g.101630 Transcript_35889/m.101630 type:complete len:171 (+) Transcript_35889:360-872(+)